MRLEHWRARRTLGLPASASVSAMDEGCPRCCDVITPIHAARACALASCSNKRRPHDNTRCASSPKCTAKTSRHKATQPYRFATGSLVAARIPAHNTTLHGQVALDRSNGGISASICAAQPSIHCIVWFGVQCRASAASIRSQRAPRESFCPDQLRATCGDWRTRRSAITGLSER